MRESETISVLKRTQEREIAPGSSIFMLIFGIYSCVVTVLRGCVPINFFFFQTRTDQACKRVGVVSAFNMDTLPNLACSCFPNYS